MEGLRAAYDAIPALTVTRAAPCSQRVDRITPLAESIRDQLQRERRARAALERDVETLRHELAALRAELGVEQRVRHMADRLERLEAGRGPVRSVASS